MRLPTWIVAVLRWSLRHPRTALALTAGTMALAGLGIGAVGHAVASGALAPEEQSPVRLTSRIWASSKDPNTGYRLDLVEVHPRDRDEFDYDASIVLWKHSSSGLEERMRGGFEWVRGSKNRIHVRLRRPTERSFDLTYVVARCAEGAYDVCLEITGMPEGPARFYSNGKMLRAPERAPRYP